MKSRKTGFILFSIFKKSQVKYLWFMITLSSCANTGQTSMASNTSDKFFSSGMRPRFLCATQMAYKVVLVCSLLMSTLWKEYPMLVVGSWYRLAWAMSNGYTALYSRGLLPTQRPQLDAGKTKEWWWWISASTDNPAQRWTSREWTVPASSPEQ